VLERIWNHIIAFVVIVLLIASAPLLTFAAAVWMAFVNRVDPDEIILSVMVGPMFVAFWYMFVASITRMARAEREGVPPRTGFLWAGGRLFGGWFLSFGSAILTVFGVDHFVGAFGINSPSRILFPALFLGVWSPVTHEVSIVCDVVSVEYTARFVSRDNHRNLLRDAVADHISDASSGEIMEQQPFVFLRTSA
jgi:hypothetical protein